MARKRKQYKIGIIRAEEMIFVEKNKLVFELRNYALKTHKSKEVMTSENRIFRTFCHDVQRNFVQEIDPETSEPMFNEDGTPKISEIEPTRLAREFTVVDMSKCEDMMVITKLLKDGFYLRSEDGDVKYTISERSPSQIRQGKGLFTTLDPKEIQKRATFNMEIAVKEVLAKVRAHAGLATSSTIEITQEDYTFDILPDFKIEREFDVEEYKEKERKLVLTRNKKLNLEPLDGQGTISVTAAIRTAHRLELISRKDREYAIELYNDVEFLNIALADEQFARIWSRIPSAFQVRFALSKGLLVVYEHQHESTDYEGKTYRDSGDVMNFWKAYKGEDRHEYDFNADILFTDSMWKRNIDPQYLKDVKLEIVLYQKPRKSEYTFMGYQYWQALNNINIKSFAAREIKKLNDTIFSDPAEAIKFLNMMDSGEDQEEFEERMERAGSKIQKITEVLHENPEMIEEQWIQKGLRDLRERFIEKMAGGRIPVLGGNPYIITAPECMFGHESKLGEGEYYFNQTNHQYAGFRSPLIHRSEAVVLNTVDVPEYHGLYRDLLVFNPYDDTLPRMGGADTDGDKIALVDDADIIKAVASDLPMLYDKGFSAGPQVYNKKNLYQFDLDTIVNDAPTIGEITNMASTWKDILQNPLKLKEVGYSDKQVDNIVKILRFMQGWSIDFPKTGYFPEIPSYVNTKKSPHWLPWSRGAAGAGIKGAEVYDSASQLGVLHDAIKKYIKQYKAMETKQDKTRKYRDFFFEMTDNADKVEEKRILPIIKAIYESYNKELQSLRDMQLDEEESKDYMSHIFDKYQRAITSIDADIASIAAAAYRVAYNKSKSKRKAVSFPWVTCYEGMLINISASTDRRLKLQKVDFEGHIDDIPDELKFYRCESKGEDYTVYARVKNDTYRVHRKNGNLFLEVGHKGLSRAKRKDIVRPEEKAMPFAIVGFKQNEQTAQSIIDILKANDGEILAKRVRDTGSQKEVRIGIFANIDGEMSRICSAAVNAKDIIGDYLPCTFKVNNIDKLNATYISKKDQTEKEAKALSLDTVYLAPVEDDEPIEEPAQETRYDDGYANEPQYYVGDDGYVDPLDAVDPTVSVDLDIELADDETHEHDALIEDLQSQLNITSVSCEITDDMITVTLTNTKNRKLHVVVDGDLKIDYSTLTEKQANAIRGSKYEKLVLAIADREADLTNSYRKQA